MATSTRIPIAIEDELRSSYLEYAMSVIIGRAIPDARDGLKPVHRRILYAMHEMRLNWNQPYRKSARVVGEVLGKYHPHGDQAVYDSLVRLAQTFSMRYPLVDGQGNFGSVDGDAPAAMRYTESRLSRLASELLADLDKDTVDFIPNFDESEHEPLPLPARVPNLLINGSAGIAVGMATNVAPHNLREIVDATVRVMENSAITIDELMVDDEASGRIGVKGPDFPTGAFIHGTAGIRQALHTGRGRVVMRARTSIEQMPGKAADRQQIVVTELPYMVNKAELIKKIAQLVRDKNIEGISDLRDESDREGMRIVFELKRDAAEQLVLNQLFQQTALQSTFGVNQLAIVAGRPRVLDLKEALQVFIDHRRDVVTRRTRFELREAEAQRELVEGLGMAVTEVDLVVKTIRESKDVDTARAALQALPLHGLEEFLKRAGRSEAELEAAKARGAYYLSERQAKAILEMRLSRLTGLEREKLAAEYADLCETIARLRAILDSEDELKRVIVGELDEIKERYGDARRTEIVPVEGEITIADLVAHEDVVVTVSHAGYIKRTPVSEYRAQGRGGRGRRTMETRDEDFVEQVFIANNHDHVLYLSDRGIAYLKKVFEIPEASRASRGRALVNFVGLEQGARIAAIVPIKEFREGDDLITCTKGGTVKRTQLSAYQNIRVTGIIGVGLEPEDQLLAAGVCNENLDIIIGTARGMSIRFPAGDVRRMGRDARGVRGIALREGDNAVSMDVIQSDQQQVLAVSEKGYGKRTEIAEFRAQGRGGIGIIAMDASERNGNVVKLVLVTPEDELIAVTDAGQLIRTKVAEVRLAGRNTQGVRVIRLDETERVVDVGLLAERDEEGQGGTNAPPSMAPSDDETPPDDEAPPDDETPPDDGTPPNGAPSNGV